MLERAYQVCLARQLELEGMVPRQEVAIPIRYQGVEIDTSYRADLVVDDCVLLELKAVERLLPIHSTQVLTYLRLSGLHVALLVNFNVTKLKFGIRRFVR